MLRDTPSAKAIIGARLIDPESGYDGMGSVVIAEGLITEVIHGTQRPLGIDPEHVIDADGHCLIPGLIDIRVRTGEPGSEPRETLKSACLAACAGGVTSMVVQPDTDPVIDEPAMVDFIMRRARDIALNHVYVAGAATRGMHGKALAEIGLMSETGALYFYRCRSTHCRFQGFAPRAFLCQWL